MASDLDFIKSEKDTWGKVYVDICYAYDSVAPFLSEKTLKIRKYINKSDVLKKYIDLLDSSESELSNKKNKLFSMFNGNKYESLLTSYKNDNRETFNQLHQCTKCQCLNCVKECKFNSCSGCRENSFIKQCDKEKLNITVHNNFTLDLTNNNTGRASRYRVLATMQDCQLDKQYIIIENLVDKEDKYILYYYPGISNDDYGEITDPEEFDYIAENYQSI